MATKHYTIPPIALTDNYDMFKRINANRDVNKPHLRRLVKSIETKNMLHLYPIIVNKEMEIIDGQHRLSAAKELGIPVFYIMDAEVTKADIALMNNNRKGWSAKDYVSFYAKDGNKAYQQLSEILTKYPKITVGTGMKLMDASTTAYFISGGNMTLKMRTGMIDGTNAELAKNIADMCAQLKWDYRFSGPFMLAVKGAILSSGLSADQCLAAILKKQKQLPEACENPSAFSNVL